MKITPATLNISQLFSCGNEQFIVPAYQRRFAWEYKQLAELFDDIDLLSPNDTHLLGTVLFLTQEHVVGLNPIELVDGQQRITSITLLLKAIKDRFEELEDGESVGEIQGYLTCKGFDKKTRPKLSLGDLDDPDFLKLMGNLDLDEVVNTKLSDAYSYFGDWISEFDLDRLSLFYFKLKNNATIIRLDVGQAKDAYKLFETINNRGLRLSPTDIIKNFLLGHASRVSDEVLDKVRRSWKALIIALDGVDTDDFFRQFMASVLGRKITKSTVIVEFKNHYLHGVKEAGMLTEYQHALQNLQCQTNGEEESNGEDPDSNGSADESAPNEKPVKKIAITKFASQLKDDAIIYGQIVKRGFTSAKINQHLLNLARIRSFPSYTFLLSLFKRELQEKDVIMILKMIESFMLRRHICEFRTNELDDIFAKLVGVSDDNIVSQVKEALAAELPSDEEFQRKFAAYDFRKVLERARYILEQLEYRAINHKGEYTLSSPEQLHLEHIIPQTIDTKKSVKDFGDWITYLGGVSAISRHRDYVNRIGNLTLLAQELNITASNNPFKAKLAEYKKSNIQLTMDLVKKFSEFRFNAVDKRSKDFAVLAPKIWSL